MSIENPHACYDALLFYQRHVVCDGHQIGQNCRNRKSACNAVSDGVGVLNDYDRARSLGHGHGGCAFWLDAYNFRCWRQGLEDMAHTSNQSASAKCEQNRIDGIAPIEEFEANSTRAFTGVEIVAVLDEKCITVGCDLSRALMCSFEVPRDEVRLLRPTYEYDRSSWD